MAGLVHCAGDCCGYLLPSLNMLRKISFIFFLHVFLTACTTTRINWDPDDYTVASGDTLYSIAWRYEIDPDDLAKWNHLSPPYIIHPGDRLHTKESDGLAADKLTIETKQQQNKPSEITVRRGDTLYSLSRENDVSVARLAFINGLKKPYVINPGQTLRLKGKLDLSSRQANAKSTTRVTRPVISTAASPVETNRSVSWQWPVKGKLIGRFNKYKNDAKGIDIAGSEGKSVKAASSGKVVYSGNGLISYGNLVIIKHSRSYLSAYAHNKKLLVKEGETVKAGQKIAELGKTGAEKPKLHFEIRKNGKPVDPLRYLPRS
ncbi:MAG: peptidoglycan DD-metalloendopeptidase family protein [Gammaproteobacteria bacterium]|nr:peptidoglycan DD-metalloendopeptidase family protein [Gammaproteobacteria bacterium]